MKNKENSRFYYLLSICDYEKTCNITNGSLFNKLEQLSLKDKNFGELLALARKMNLLEDELVIEWLYFKHERRIERRFYNSMPKRNRSDNKDHKSGSGFSNGNANTIRYPKKCRKTAWKRFYKLFPHLKNKKV